MFPRSLHPDQISCLLNILLFIVGHSHRLYLAYQTTLHENQTRKKLFKSILKQDLKKDVSLNYPTIYSNNAFVQLRCNKKRVSFASVIASSFYLTKANQHWLPRPALHRTAPYRTAPHRHTVLPLLLGVFSLLLAWNRYRSRQVGNGVLTLHLLPRHTTTHPSTPHYTTVHHLPSPPFSPIKR